MPEIDDHAPVVGASMGGLLAVHVLADSRQGPGRVPAPELDLSRNRLGLLALAPGRSGLCDELALC
jgi:hypothetical protein